MATVGINVSPVDDPPIAVGESYVVPEGGTLTAGGVVNGAKGATNGIVPGVLDNDNDPEGNPLTATLVDDVAHGSLTLNGDGSFNYTHNGSETTSDSFTYKANDGAVDSKTATVTITVTPVNDPPIGNNDTYAVAEGASLTTPAKGVLANDTDPEDDPLSAILVSKPIHGTLALSPNGTFTYAHDGSETTGDKFTYKANDGLADSNVTTANITIKPVNDPPVAKDDSYTVLEGGILNNSGISNIDSTVNIKGVLDNDTDAEGDQLSAIKVTGPTHGTLTLNANGSFTYIHDGSETTEDKFTYKANDGVADSNVAIVLMTVNRVNDVPVAKNDSFSVATWGDP